MILSTGISSFTRLEITSKNTAVVEDVTAVGGGQRKIVLGHPGTADELFWGGLEGLIDHFNRNFGDPACPVNRRPVFLEDVKRLVAMVQGSYLF